MSAGVWFSKGNAPTHPFTLENHTPACAYLSETYTTQVSDCFLLETVIIPVCIDNACKILTFVADKGGPTVHINGILGEIV